MTCCLVNNETDLAAALVNGGEIRVDSSVIITLSQTINVTEPTKIIGGKFVKSSGAAFYITSSNVEFHGVQIAGGDVGAGYDSTQKLIYAQGTETVPLGNLWFNDCKLFGSRGDNLWLEWCRECNLTNNLVKRFLYSGIMLVSCEGMVVDGNNIYDGRLIDPPVKNVYGIAATDLDNTEAARSRDITITGNRVHQVDWEGIDTHGGDRITITGNTVTACPRGIALVTGNKTRTISPTRCVVSGNNVDGTNVRKTIREGIWLGGIENIPADGVVTGNLVTGYPAGKSLETPYVDRSKTFVGGNQPAYVEWSAITMDGDFTGNGTYVPEYKVDGNTVSVRGGVIPKSSTAKVIGHLASAHARPDVLSFLGYVKSSKPDGTGGNGMVGVHPDGTVELFYGSGLDGYTYFLSGSYEAV